MKHQYFLSTLVLLGWLIGGSLQAQAPKKPTSADIHDDIKRLNVLASALYVAAHPDDENTRLIAYLSNHLRVNTAYLSLTRGDGGQNLIGTEIRELLGVIRTQELLGARRIDGGQQLFSRANDFGYSKNPEETLKIWNKDEVLADVVWAIRNWQPDIIINRFSHDSGRRTHGHHTTSAILSYEAFDLVGDSKAYPEQLQYVSTWQPKRLFFNTSWWFFGSREKFAQADKSKMVSVDVGTYYPLKGKSNTEIAAESRSMHRCQGFGSTGTRGSMSEYLQLLKGDMPSNREDLFEGINTTWTRVKGGAPIGQLISKIEEDFKYDDPAASVPQLLEAFKMIESLSNSYWRTVKLAEIQKVILACMGIYIEAVAEDYSVVAGGQIPVMVEMINRSGIKAVVERLQLYPEDRDTIINLTLENNQLYKQEFKLHFDAQLPTTSPYWLNDPASLGMYTVNEQLLRGKPETPRTALIKCQLRIEGVEMQYVAEVVHKKNDPVMGEQYRPFEILPPVTANIAEKVYVFASDEPKQIEVLVGAGQPNLKGQLRLALPPGWRAEPAQQAFDLQQKGQEQRLSFTVYPSKTQSEGQVKAVAQLDGQDYDRELVLIEYDHIPTQSVLRPSAARIVRVDLKRLGDRIGYLMGAGDEIPASLEQIGYSVTLLDDRNLSAEGLQQFDAVILGIRAFNTVDRLKFKNQELMDYVEQGGTLIVQYNTAHRLKTKDIAPYPLKLSRDRVTVEEAEIRMLQPDHFVLNFPNKIGPADFDHWVQERGLYFPNEWDDKFEAILSSNDPGEPARDGGLLVAQHGKGYYVYTGYSWFRQLPAGVPGAYRLFTNLISVGQRP
ncbi:MAG: PIG-L family deacetylase [Bacteroidota bacterium]